MAEAMEKDIFGKEFPYAFQVIRNCIAAFNGGGRGGAVREGEGGGAVFCMREWLEAASLHEEERGGGCFVYVGVS